MDYMDSIYFDFYYNPASDINEFGCWDCFAEDLLETTYFRLQLINRNVQMKLFPPLRTYILAYIAAYTGCPDSF